MKRPAFPSKLALFTGLSILLFPLSCQPIKSLGKNPSGDELKKIETLPNYKAGEFQNLERIQVDSNNTGRRGPRWTSLLKYLLGKPKTTQPPGTLPSVLSDLKNTAYPKPTVIWFGHSSFLLKTATANILVDPNFSGYAGPLRGMITAFKGSNVYDAGDMPIIDALVISHDHYDHLDYETVRQLRKKVKRVIVPIGVGSHFLKWGYKPQSITELNWNESISLNGKVKLTATPAHHRSNRTFASRKTLWASYVIEADGYKIFYSGDTGYSKHFRLIGERYGPFDLAMMECGQYNKRWSQSHMHPTQTAKAATDLKTSLIIPVHWGKFAESDHVWNEPVQLLLKSADSLQLPVVIPFIGQPYTIGDTLRQDAWWDL
ncbi:MAG TPA: MBL fold metallo-hydrolase [Flavisolibacter sp.]|nr:MBL fold metallo-hydrolase [Flavisolibacter sp.]